MDGHSHERASTVAAFIKGYVTGKIINLYALSWSDLNLVRIMPVSA